MKRDMDLVRNILKALTETDSSVQASVFVSEQYSLEEITYHFEIMQEAGLIDANIQRSFSGKILVAEASRLTWEGNDFYSAIKQDSLWQSVKLRLAKVASDAPLEVIKALAIKVFAKTLGL